MTNKKALFEMKKELKAIKKLMDKENKKAKKYNRRPRTFEDYGWRYFPTYVFITKQGELYGIDDGETSFPDIDIKDIVYVNKKYGFYYHKKGNRWYNMRPSYTYHDTIQGKFNKYTIGYAMQIEKKFNVVKSDYVLY